MHNYVIKKVIMAIFDILCIFENLPKIWTFFQNFDQMFDNLVTFWKNAWDIKKCHYQFSDNMIVYKLAKFQHFRSFWTWVTFIIPRYQRNIIFRFWPIFSLKLVKISWPKTSWIWNILLAPHLLWSFMA